LEEVWALHYKFDVLQSTPTFLLSFFPSHSSYPVCLFAGSGGLGCAKRAAGYGASVAIIEGNKYGGTCVNVGCVPKKVMYNASHMMEAMEEAKNFGWVGGWWM
jgi:hypothetical protein